LVQNKADLIDADGGGGAQMSVHEVESLAKRLNIRLFRTSVKLDTNVKDVFEHLATEFILRSNAPPEVVKQTEEKSNSSSSSNASSSSSSLSASLTTNEAAINSNKSAPQAPAGTSSLTTASAVVTATGGLANALLPAEVVARVIESNGPPAPAGTIRLGSTSDKAAIKRKKTGIFSAC
jgi:hypothetical protein